MFHVKIKKKRNEKYVVILNFVQVCIFSIFCLFVVFFFLFFFFKF